MQFPYGPPLAQITIATYTWPIETRAFQGFGLGVNRGDKYITTCTVRVMDVWGDDQRGGSADSVLECVTPP